MSMTAGDVTRGRPPAAPVERLRITFAVTGSACYIGHLDLARAWVRALRRLQLPVAYTHGYNPRPRLSIAAPLPVGFAGEQELLEALFDSPVDPQALTQRLLSELPNGLALRGIEKVSLQAPPLPSQVIAADYVVSFFEPPPTDLPQRVEHLMATASIPFTRIRQGKKTHFDLRPRILKAQVPRRDGQAILILRLAHGPGGAARPEDVLEALGLEVGNARITRTGLVLAGEP